MFAAHIFLSDGLQINKVLSTEEGNARGFILQKNLMLLDKVAQLKDFESIFLLVINYFSILLVGKHSC